MDEKEYKKQWYEKNKERLKQQQKEYSEKNKEKINQRRKEYREKNKEKVSNEKKQWYENNKERILEKRKEYYEVNKERINEYKKSWYLKNHLREIQKRRTYRKLNIDAIKAGKKLYLIKYPMRNALKCRDWKRRNPLWQRKHILKKYNLTQIEYEQLLTLQNNSCYICGIKQNMIKKNLCVDHDHATGKVRGLLCVKCNTLLGLCQDSISILQKSIEYLTKTPFSQLNTNEVK